MRVRLFECLERVNRLIERSLKIVLNVPYQLRGLLGLLNYVRCDDAAPRKAADCLDVSFRLGSGL